MTYELTYADKTRIVKDWAVQFPEMAMDRKSMRIWKRVGPLLFKISVYTRTSMGIFPRYKPQWTIHALYERMSSPGSMALTYSLRDITWKADRLPDYWDKLSEERKQAHIDSQARYYALVSDSIHYDKYLEAAEDIKQNSFIKTIGLVSLNDIWQGVESYFKCSLDPYKGIRVCIYEGIIPIFTAIWAGEIEKAREYYKWWEDWVNKIDEKDFQHNPPMPPTNSLTDERSKYKKQMLYYMDHPDELRQIVRDEVVIHKLAKVPYQNILGVKYQE